ncbi:hypothetical protein TWF730_005970 [Orbilia blumenaviensis]|uniref:PLAC8-domain-containing protein n=1 Tax=Orbilia blumenaviensis TaxID=1796055 RepID=A0AAV9VM89_9PEZI
MSYQTEPKAIYPDHQAQAPYGQPVQSPPPNYQQQQQYPQPDQQLYQQSPPPQQSQQSPPPQQFQQYPSYQEHQHSTPPQAISPTPVQPTPHPQMEQKGVTNHAGKPGPWQHGMCGCFGDCGKCCMTFWCPCITYGKIQHRLRNNDMSNYSNCNGHCWGFCGLMCLCGVQWVMGMMQRGEIRQRYNVEGSGFGDCCRHFWCECCVLIQEDRETEARKALLVPANQTGYQQTEGMSYPANY